MAFNNGTTASIACIAVIGKANNPLHISLFPAGARPSLQYSLLLSSTLDIFEARMLSKTPNSDFGLLQAVNETLALYGWLTNTGVKFVVGIEVGAGNDPSSAARIRGKTGGRRRGDDDETEEDDEDDEEGEDEPAPIPLSILTGKRPSGGVGLSDADVKPVFRALQTAYVQLLQNPFYDPDEHNSFEAVRGSHNSATGGGGGGGGVGGPAQIRSRRFIEEVTRIGESWVPGMKDI